jgi:hypothetical protein
MFDEQHIFEEVLLSYEANSFAAFPQAREHSEPYAFIAIYTQLAAKLSLAAPLVAILIHHVSTPIHAVRVILTYLRHDVGNTCAFFP